jgi:hypothetical protein
MARKPNYDFEKRRKEQDRKAKKDAKLADRQRRREERGNEEEAGTPADAPIDGEEGAGGSAPTP